MSSIVSEFQRIVNVVNTKIMSELRGYDANIETLNFQYGDLVQINTKLTQLDTPEFRNTKMPLIGLLPYDINRSKSGDYDQFVGTLLLANKTLSEYDNVQRQKENFIPILDPLYEALIYEISRSRFFVILDPQRDMPHRKSPVNHWGSESGGNNVAYNLNTATDVIFIYNLTINLSQQNCN